jgi:hypothetical protein
LSLTSFKGFCSIDVIYRLPGPVEGGIRPHPEALNAVAENCLDIRCES